MNRLFFCLLLLAGVAVNPAWANFAITQGSTFPCGNASNASPMRRTSCDVKFLRSYAKAGVARREHDDAMRAATARADGPLGARDAPVHPLQRDAFLKALAAELEKHPAIGPGVVHRCAAELQKTFVVAAHSKPSLAPAQRARQAGR
jgi:hypothetical protein